MTNMTNENYAKGGSWISVAWGCRSANRYRGEHHYSGSYGGFRILIKEKNYAKGGSWDDSPELCRSAVRFDHDFPDGRLNYVGFRIIIKKKDVTNKN